MERLSSHPYIPLKNTSERGRFWSVLLVGLIFMTISACQAQDAESVLPDDGPAPEFSQAAAGSLLQKVISAGQSTAAGEVVELHLTQQEVNSFLALGDQLSKAMGSQNLNPQMMENLQELYGVEGLGQLEDLQFEGEPEILRSVRERLTSGEEGGISLASIRDLRPRLIQPQVLFKSSGDVILRGYGALLWWKIPMRVVFEPRVAESLRLEFKAGQLGRLPLPVGLLNWAGDILSRTIPEKLNLADIQEVHVSGGEIRMRGSILSQLRLLEGLELSP